MPQPKEISPGSASRENRQTQGVLLVKQSEFDEPSSRTLTISRRLEVLELGTKFSSIEPTQEWDVLGGGTGPANSTEAGAGTGLGTGTIEGGRTAEETQARTNENSVLRDHDQDPDNAQPGPSRIRRSKVDRATTRSKRRDVETRGASVQMHTMSSSERLAADESDSSSLSSTDIQRRPRQLLVGWDSFRSRTMLLLIILLVVWAVIYFPLILT